MIGKLTGWQRLGLVLGVPVALVIAAVAAPELIREFPKASDVQTKHLRYIAGAVTNMMGRNRVGALKEGESVSAVEVPPGGGYYDNSGAGRVEFDVRQKHPGMSDKELIAMLRTKYAGKVTDFDMIDAGWQQEEDQVGRRQVEFMAKVSAMVGGIVFGAWLLIRLLAWVMKGFRSPTKH